MATTLARTALLFVLCTAGNLVRGQDSENNPIVDPALDTARLRATIDQGVKELQASSATLSDDTNLDLAKLVNAFIGTRGNNNPGNVCPAAAIPFGVALLGIDVDDAYAPPGYITNTTASVRGLSVLHDSGTGSSLGSFGNFGSFPVVCPGNDFNACPTRLDDRKRWRQPGKDYASPGYFTLTLNNSIQMEATSTRRAGLIRYTFPDSVLQGGKFQPHIVQDWTVDAPGTFTSGTAHLDIDKGRAMLNGSWGSSFGPRAAKYRAYACVDFLDGGKQKIAKAGLWQGNRFGMDVKLEGTTAANLSSSSPQQQTGVLVSFSDFPKAAGGKGGASITLRVGISYNSPEQACKNAEEEIVGVNGGWSFNGTVAKARAQWNDKLNRIRLDPSTNATIAELFYSSLYYSFLTPHNATGEAGNLNFPAGSPPDAAKTYQGNYYDGLYCTWDSYRTFFPFLSLTSPREYAQIVDSYVDGWRKEGWIPECRANLAAGFVQGGSHGVMVIADFVAKYGKQAEQLGLSLQDAYQAVFKDAFVTPESWIAYGRQVGVYDSHGYVPFAIFDTSSNGIQTREASRTVEYAHNDFGARTVALAAGHKDVAATLANRSLSYRNTFDTGVSSMGFSTFVQKRYPNGTFFRQDPTLCSPLDQTSSACSLQQENTAGTYETSSWEYSFYAPHDVAGLMNLLTANSSGSTTPSNTDTKRATFISRLDTFFNKDLYYAGNEPSFSTPWLYHYANSPARTARRVRQVVFRNFNTTTAGLPGNSDVGAMQTLLNFHLLGLFPVVATRELLLGSPFVPGFRIRNEMAGTLTVKVTNFDAKSVMGETIPNGARAFVGDVLLNGKKQGSRCRVAFEDLFPGPGSNTTLELVMTADEKAVDKCGDTDAELPQSLSTGGFAEGTFAV